MPAPTLISYGETTWNVTGTSKSATALTWLTGDLVVVMSEVEDANVAAVVSVANQLGLTFTHDGVIGTSGVTCGADSWHAVASSDQTSQQIVATNGDNTRHWGIAVWVFRGHGGTGNRATDISTAKTVSLTRAGNNSMVTGVQGDFLPGAIAGYSFTPTVGNDREHLFDSGKYTVYVADWGDQGPAGTTSYGTTGETSTGTFAKIALEIKGLPDAGGPVPASVSKPARTPRKLHRTPLASVPDVVVAPVSAPTPGPIVAPNTAVHDAATW